MITIASKSFLEEYARHMLKHLLNFDITKFDCSDRPDIQNYNDGIGIEVVEDTYQDEKELLRFWVEYENTSYDEIPQKKIEGYRKRGGRLEAFDNRLIGGQIGKTKRNTPQHLIETIIKKISKLNAGIYTNFPTYMLYVFTDTVSLTDSNVLIVMQEIEKIKSTIGFEKILLDGHFELCCCEMKQCEFKRQQITKETREMVIVETKSILANKV